MDSWRQLLSGQGDRPDAAWVREQARFYLVTCGFNINPDHYEALAIVEGRDKALEALWQHIKREAREVAYG